MKLTLTLINPFQMLLNLTTRKGMICIRLLDEIVIDNKGQEGQEKPLHELL